jgi:putative peptide zinc metalloprotease protein
VTWPGGAYDDETIPVLPPSVAPASVQTGATAQVRPATASVPAVVGTPAPEPARPATGGVPVLPTALGTAPRRAGRGWQATVRRATFGLVSPRPGRAEQAELDDTDAVRAAVCRPMTVVVCNPKGGAGKTATVVGLAGAFGSVRAGGVLAWDNNETLGTLGVRVPAVAAPRNAVDLLGQLAAFEQVHARRGDLAGYVRPQEATYHVLASDEDPGRQTAVDWPAFARLHTVLARYYDVIVVDTGNNPRTGNFLAAAAVADVLVIPVAWSPDKTTGATRLIEQLHRHGLGAKAATAVTVVTGAAGAATGEQRAALQTWFAQNTGIVVTVPHDKHLAGGGPVVHSQLARPTRRAYLKVAAEVARRFPTTPPAPQQTQGARA